MSVASAAAAEQEKTTGDLGYYNLAFGPVGLRFQGQLGVEASDNVNYTKTSRQADVAFTPGLNIRAMWPITEQNRLLLSVGIGYTKYVKTTSLDHLDVSPDSTLSFQMYVSDFVINIHERLSVTEDVSQNPAISGTGAFGEIDNTAGVGATWDLNQLLLTLSYDHETVRATASSFNFTDHDSELFNLRAAFGIDQNTTAGVEVGGGLTAYDRQDLPQSLNDSFHYSAGPFYEARFSPFLRTKLSAGYVGYTFESLNGAPPPPNVNTYYADWSITHRVNRWLDHNLDVGRQLQLGITSDTLDLYYVRYQANLAFLRNVVISPHLSYEHGKESNGTPEIFDRYGGGVTASWQITQKLTGNAIYELFVKNSDISANDYIQNRLVLTLSYSF